VLGWAWFTHPRPSKIWVISHLAGADLAIYPGKAGKQRKYISVVLAASHPCPTSDGLETA
jgi:hypothetical protein